MKDFGFIKIKGSRQYGDNFLFNISCPFCKSDIFTPFPFVLCDTCEKDLGEYNADIEKTRYKCVVGSIRKKYISKKLIKQMMEAQEGLCAYCGEKMEEMHVEHIKPLCCGGTNNPLNLCLACKSCNVKAGGKWFNSFYEKQEYIITKRKLLRENYYD